jgi:hypothetical protein
MSENVKCEIISNSSDYSLKECFEYMFGTEIEGNPEDAELAELFEKYHNCDIKIENGIDYMTTILIRYHEMENIDIYIFEW